MTSKREINAAFDVFRKYLKRRRQKLKLIARYGDATGRYYCARWVFSKQRKRGACPKWADKQAIFRVYIDCPPDKTIDHIIPLRGENVCGLHIPENLQYMSLEENAAKGNKLLAGGIQL